MQRRPNGLSWELRGMGRRWAFLSGPPLSLGRKPKSALVTDQRLQSVWEAISSGALLWRRILAAVLLWLQPRLTNL